MEQHPLRSHEIGQLNYQKKVNNQPSYLDDRKDFVTPRKFSRLLDMNAELWIDFTLQTHILAYTRVLYDGHTQFFAGATMSRAKTDEMNLLVLVQSIGTAADPLLQE